MWAHLGPSLAEKKIASLGCSFCACSFCACSSAIRSLRIHTTRLCRFAVFTNQPLLMLIIHADNPILRSNATILRLPFELWSLARYGIFNKTHLLSRQVDINKHQTGHKFMSLIICVSWRCSSGHFGFTCPFCVAVRSLYRGPANFAADPRQQHAPGSKHRGWCHREGS